jgi:hypothetical protein
LQAIQAAYNCILYLKPSNWELHFMPVRTRTLPPQLLWTGLCLAFCLVLALYQFNTHAAGQTTCQVACDATAPNIAAIGDNVAFAATSTAANCATPVTYEWDFGDGGLRATTANAIHGYVAPGTYTWRMTARAGGGSAAPAMIDTIAGGYGEGVAARQAPLSRPTALARDPLGRGIYVFDQAISGDGLRFINTSTVDVVLAGKRIEPGTSRVLPTDYVPNANSGLILVVQDLAVSTDGNLLYISNVVNSGLSYEILALNISNIPQTVFGTTVAPGRALQLGEGFFGQPRGIAVHPQTGEVYVSNDGEVFRVTGLNSLSKVAGYILDTPPSLPFIPGPALQTSLKQVSDLAFDPAGTLYIADTGHGRVVKMDSNNQVTLVAQFSVGTGGNTVIIPPYNTPPHPTGLAFFNGKLYIALGNAQTLVRVDGNSTPIIAGAINVHCVYGNSNCGDNGDISNARFNLTGSSAAPNFVGLAGDTNGLFVLDQGEVLRGRVRYLNLSASPVQIAGTTIAANQIATIAGTGAAPPFDNGPALGAALSQPSGLTLDANGNLWFADTQRGTLRFVNRGTQPVTIFANTPAAQTVAPGHIVTVNKDPAPNAPNNISVNQATFETPQGLFATSEGIFLADMRKGRTWPPLGVAGYRTSLIRFINTGNQDVTFYAGTAHQVIVPKGFVGTIAGGEPLNGNLNNPFDVQFAGALDIAVSPVTNDIYVANMQSILRIRRVNGTVTRLLGTIAFSVSGNGLSYAGIAFDTSGRLLVLEATNRRLLRQQTPESDAFNNLAPLLTGAPLNSPRDVAVDGAGSIYVTNAGSSHILKITLNGNVATSQVLAGSTPGYSGDGGPPLNAQLNLQADPVPLALLPYYSPFPTLVGITTSSTGEIFFADSRNQRIRRISENTVVCVKTDTITITGNAPLPMLSQVSPTTAYVGQPFTLTVSGNGFGPVSQVLWNGSPRATTFVSATQLLATIPAGDLTAAGIANVTVINPAPGGGTSNGLGVTLVRIPSIPAIGQLEPLRVRPGVTVRLTISGSNFTPNTEVRIHNLALTTTFINEGTLQADIPASAIPNVGVAMIRTFTPAPGGGLSNPANLYVGCTPLIFTPAQLPPATTGITYSQTLGVENVVGQTTISLSSGNLPPGLTLNSVGVLSGVPTNVGTYSFTIRATDATGCSGTQLFTLLVNCVASEITPFSISEGEKGLLYSQSFFACGLNNPRFSVTAGGPPPGLTLSPDGLLSGMPTQAGSFTFTVTATSTGGTRSRTYTLGIRNFSVTFAETATCISPGSIVPVEVSLTNHTTSTQIVLLTAGMSGTLKPVGQCSASIGSCNADPAGIALWRDTLLPGQTVNIRYFVQILDTGGPGAQFCVIVGSSLHAGTLPRSACLQITCPPSGPGTAYPFASAISDQKAGSVLLFNLYTSDAGAPNRQNTRLSLTNTDVARTAYVHLFFVDGASCTVADSVVCLTANQTSTFFASDVDPGTTGYVIAVATDRNGCPINFNYLIGDAYVKLNSGHAANLAAEAIAALPGGFVPCDPNAAAVELRFDNLMYNALPRVLALSNIGSMADGNNTLLVVNCLGGNLATGAATLTGVFGILYDDAEAPFSFSFSPGLCQFRSLITNSFPRTAPRFEQIVPAGRSGWLKLGMQTDGAISGAALNFNVNAATSANAFNQGHNLHKLTLTPSATLTIPVFPPSC